MSWRVQAEDPIEKCEEAERVWVIFKKDSGYESHNPEICFFDGYSVEIINTDGLFAELTDITHWQLIPTPAMPERFLNAEELEQVTTQYNNVNKKS